MERLTNLLKQPIETKINDSSACLRWVREINDTYLGLERDKISADKIVQLKFAMILWRSALLDRLIECPPEWAKRRQEEYVEILIQLKTHIPKHRHAKLANLLNNKELFALLMAKQGIRRGNDSHITKTAGPTADLKISANRSSSWPFSRWKERKEYSKYEFEDDGVHYRGVFFRPGDVLLANVNLDGNGVYTSLSDPKGFSSHSAFLAILKDDGDRFPAVIETYEKGVRAVPLNVFLGPRFSSYIEVYRCKALSSRNSELINSSALNIIESVNGYNFDSEDKDRQYMSCTSVGRFLLQDAGLEPVKTKSSICVPTIVNNLKKVGYTYFSFFAPVDYLLDENFYCVGWVDNNQFTKLLARELVDRQFREQFSQRELNPSEFPLMCRINSWGIRHIRRQTPIGKLISLIEGFDHINLPKGPDELIAVITQVESQLGKAIKKIHTFVEEHVRHRAYFDLENVAADERIRATLEDNLKLAWLKASVTNPDKYEIRKTSTSTTHPR